MTKLIGRHLRNNVVGYVALTVALGGTSYAATNPNATRAHVQGSTAHVARDPQLINGSIRAWAIIGPAGRVIASAGKPKVTPQAGDPGGYGIRWGVKVGRCDTQATVDVTSSPATERVPLAGNPSVPFTAGYAIASTNGGRRGGTYVQTYNQQGLPTPLGFDVTVIC